MKTNTLKFAIIILGILLILNFVDRFLLNFIRTEQQKAILSEAVTKSNLELCKKFYNPHTCYVLIARKTNNISICNIYNISEEEFRDYRIVTCVASVLNNKSICDKLSEYLVSVCIWEINNVNEDNKKFLEKNGK